MKAGETYGFWPGRYPAIVRGYDAGARMCRVEIPGLTDGGDVLPLAEYFLEEAARKTGVPFKRISTPAIDLISQYHWPDNVRELHSCMERAFEQSEDGVIRAYHLPPTLQTAESSNTEATLSFGEAVDQFERELLIEALKKAKGNMFQAAKDLRESYRIINYKVASARGGGRLL